MIKPLTSLRFLFSMLVFVSHSTFVLRSYSTLNWPFDFTFTEGKAGVSFFFILSGFILAKSYSRDLLSGAMSKSKFLVKRIARIYPLHLVTLVSYLPYYIYSMTANSVVLTDWNILKIFLLNALLLQSYYPQMEVYFSFNAPAWSISDAMFFYLAFPLLIYLVTLFKKLYVFGLVLLSAVLFASMTFIPTEFSHYVFYVNPFVRLLDFAIGIGLFSILKNIESNASILRGTLFECCAIVVLVVFLALHHHVADVYRYSMYYWPPAIFIITSIYFQKGLISRILESKWPVFLGNISFSFYLLHWQLIKYISGINHQLDLTGSAILLITFTLFITLLCSSISYRYLEKPLITKINSAYKRRHIISI